MRRTAVEFDGIVLGAGHHGLILATYLARCGLKVLLLERRLQHGGGLSTEQATLPGFYHNLHSINHFAITSAPWFRDLELAERVEYIRPRVEFVQPHRDGTALTISPDLELTLRSLAEFSEKDARTYARLNPKAELWAEHILLPERYSEPLADAERRSLWSGSELGREFISLTDQMPYSVIDELFEHDKIKTLLLFKLSIFGTILVETVFDRSPVGSVVRALEVKNCYQLCKGGSWNLARGLMESFIAAGGVYRNQSEVARIVIEGGRATGVELSSGEQFRARQFVASTLGPHQTFFDYVGESQLSLELRERVAAFKYTSWALFGAHFALKQAPNYPASARNPLVNRAQKYHIGEESLEDVERQHHAIVNKLILEKPQFGGGALTVMDPSQAPPGYHTAYAWQPVPLVEHGQPGEIDALAADYADRVLEVWREYAPNMTRDNVLATYTYTPHMYVQQMINMIDGDIFVGALTGDQVMDNHFGYRTGIPGLYMGGSSVHPGGAISGGGGYICAGVIADDLGLERWWPRIDLERHAESLRTARVETVEWP
jgi:phytoene dehydrogenase-like protein